MASIDPGLLEPFPAEVRTILRDAYDRACRSLHDIGQPGLVQEVLAERIIKLAREGERDPRKLCEEALSGLGVHSECE